MEKKFAGMVALLCAVMLAAASSSAVADNTDGPSIDEIRKQQVELRGEVAKGAGIFESMSDGDRETLVARQDELLALIEGADEVEDLTDPDQVRAFNLLQQINTMVNDLGDQDVICEYRRKTGSHRKEKVCTTMAERREQRDAAQRAMQKTLDRFCSPIAGTCGG